MTQQDYRHPIAPPPELVQQWWEDFNGAFYEFEAITAKVFQAGADQELLACGNYLKQCAAWEEEDVTEFYKYRRPKPLSLKKLALESVKRFEKSGVFFSDQMRELEFIHRALEALPE